MKSKLKSLIFGSALYLISSLAIADTTYQRYGTNIEYQDFSKINFSSISNKKIKIPSDLESILNDKTLNPKIKDNDKFKEEIFDRALKLGYDINKIKSLQPDKAVKLSLDIVKSRFTYLDVDTDKEFIKTYGDSLTLDQYYDIGYADCGKYSYLLVYVFNLFKEINPNLQNYYMSDNRLGSFTNHHCWNVLIGLKEKELIISHIDPTSYDATGIYEIKKGNEISDNDLEIIADLYKYLGDYDTSFVFNKYLYENNGRKSKYLDEMKFLANQLDDEKKEIVRQYSNVSPVVAISNNTKTEPISFK